MDAWSDGEMKNFRFYILDFRLKTSKLSWVILNIFLLLIVSSCTNTEELRKRELAEERKTFFAKYEAEFNPSDYPEEDYPDTIPEVKTDSVQEEIPMEEMISGFRVQVYLSENIDSAKIFFQSINPKLETEWVYMVYDAPLYKIRVGDFQDRVGATETMNALIQMGFANAWLVPDKVRKFPPEKPFQEFYSPVDTMKQE
ncbi:MAG: SPOR domain-containing protein [Ignavibacteriales bacterium]|nr:SPOR domain-containing protein [Ignavibacteriales bacterium]